MKQRLLASLGMIAFLTNSQTAFSNDIQWNGFISAIGGRTLNAEKLSNGSNSQFTADNPSSGIYQDHLTFEPESIYGLQGHADVGNDLSVTGQITGSGGEDFNAQIKWAYLSYIINDTFTLQAGRQRLPGFFYSDYLDVGYAYHWIRPPTEVYIATVDVFEGAQLLASSPIGEHWDANFQLYGGKGDNQNNTILTNEKVTWLNLYGGAASIQNDWLQLRANFLRMNHASSNGSWNNKSQDEDSGGVPLQFWGLAAHAQINNIFLGTEVILAKWDEPFRADQAQGITEWRAYFITTGYQIGQFTPHLTYANSKYTTEDNSLFGGVGTAPDTDVGSSSWTLGLRWDFHPNSAFKIEYLTRQDESDKNLINMIGKLQKVDLISAGFDVVF